MQQSHIKKSLQALAKIDKDIALGLSQFGYPEPRIRPAGFETFLNTIVSQQISTKAAATISLRVSNLMTRIDAELLLALPDIALREAGLSQRKMEYAQGLAEAIVTGEFEPDALNKMGDDKAINAIMEIRGFGRWSAEIYLIFSLQREDIFPADDLILLTSLQKLKNLADRPTPKTARKLTQHWSPWLSSASLFLWHYHRHTAKK
jgi:DNA-3-methyladenine glycosylase II